MKINTVRYFTRAFTMVELLVVIAIIIILTGIIVTNLTASKSKVRDGKRISDMGQIQIALELYFDRCKQYPAPTSGSLSTGTYNGCPTYIDQNGNTVQVNFGTYIATVPRQPNQLIYDYAVNNAGLPTDYVLHVTLENSNDVLKDSMATNPYGGFSCYNGSNKEYCLGPK